MGTWSDENWAFATELTWDKSISIIGVRALLSSRTRRRPFRTGRRGAFRKRRRCHQEAAKGEALKILVHSMCIKNVARANEKGRLESGVGYVKKSFLRGLELTDFSAIQAAAQVWLETIANAALRCKDG
jgi:hypothetical protein